MAKFSLFLVAALAATATADLLDSRAARRQAARSGRQDYAGGAGIDFSNAQFDPETGKRCVLRAEEVQSIEKEPILECNHKNVEKCHYTYVTQFSPAQEEVCEENFEKKCQITFKQQAVTETVKKCYKPLEKVCNGQGPEECRTVYESSCSTRYIEKQPGKFVGDTKCEKLPIEICGAGCVTEEGPEECHDKQVTSLVDVPEEVCDLNPQKTCRFQTKLVPNLKPEHECTIIPQESCNLRFTSPKLVSKPLQTKWCLDESEVVPDETYDDNNARARPIGAGPRNTSPVQNVRTFGAAASASVAQVVPQPSAPVYSNPAPAAAPSFSPRNNFAPAAPAPVSAPVSQGNFPNSFSSNFLSNANFNQPAAFPNNPFTNSRSAPASYTG